MANAIRASAPRDAPNPKPRTSRSPARPARRAPGRNSRRSDTMVMSAAGPTTSRVPAPNGNGPWRGRHEDARDTQGMAIRVRPAEGQDWMARVQDRTAVRRPGRLRSAIFGPVAAAEIALVRAIRRHVEDLDITQARGAEEDPAPVRGPAWCVVIPRRARQAAMGRSVDGHGPDLDLATVPPRVDDRTAVG